ncbi:MAG: DegQ family serine endoprotease [Blastocatellia bacterium]|nr:DegQ family serine endoprotease [Blastocatellia bacterium]
MNTESIEETKTFVRRHLRAFLLTSGFIAAMFLGAALGDFRGGRPTFAQTPPVATPASYVTGTVSYAPIVNQASPAVVTIRADQKSQAVQANPFQGNPFFQEFFGNRAIPQFRTPKQSALGSGVIVRGDGYILTNNHVVDGADSIKVELTDKRTFDAKVIGKDKPSDLAVLKINAGGLPALPLGDSTRVQVGDVVLAIGNPLGVGQTVTMGIISAKGRATDSGDGSFEDFLQTDAPINHGNSGGALINTGGELVGINSQIVSNTGGSIGIGLAIPANMARNVMDQLIKNGAVHRGRLGVQIQAVTSDIAASLGLKEVQGALVNSVQADSPAERAGIQRGDVIVGINGIRIADSNLLRNQIAALQPGTAVTLTIIRNGEEKNVNAVLGELSADANSKASPLEPAGGENGSGKLGVQVQPVTPETAERLGLKPNEQGLMVAEVTPNGPAEEAGIQPGDVIQEVNRKPVRNAADLKAALQAAGQKPILLLLNRRGNTLFLTVRNN